MTGLYRIVLYTCTHGIPNMDGYALKAARVVDPCWHPLNHNHVGIWEGDILCAEKTAEHAAEGAPVSSSFTLQQRHVFRDKNEAGMQGDAWSV